MYEYIQREIFKLEKQREKAKKIKCYHVAADRDRRIQKKKKELERLKSNQ